MAKYQWTAKDETVGQPPTGLQNALEGSLADWVIAANAGALGGKTIKLVDGLSQARRRLIIPGANGGSGRIDVRGRFYRAGSSSTQSLNFAVVRLKGASATDGYEYRADLDTSSSRPRIGRYNGSAYTEIAEAAAPYGTTNEWLSFRYTFKPDATPNHVLKVWRDSETEETGSVLTTSGLSAAVDGAGVGFGALQVNSSEYNWITVGTGDDDADLTPTEGGGGTPPAGTTTITDVAPGTTSALVTYGYSASDQTGFECRVNGGAASSIGASPATISGLTAGTPYSLEVRAINAAGAGSWSAAYGFSTAAAGDTTPPTLTGVVSFSDVTQTSCTASWPAGSDNVAVTGYEYQIGGTAGAWTDAGNNLSAAITGRTAGATETVYVRAYDAAGNRSTPPIAGTVTLLSASTDGTITVGAALYPVKYSSESVLNESGLRATVLDATTLAEVLNTSGVVCSAGVITITDPALVIGNTYHLAVKTSAGWTGFSDEVTAA